MSRHGRQARLAGVGPFGQARIASASVDVPLTGGAADVAVRYLAGAGIKEAHVHDVRLIDVASAIDPRVAVDVVASSSDSAAMGDVGDGADPWPCFGLRHEAAQELARGAYLALRAVRAALEDVR